MEIEEEKNKETEKEKKIRKASEIVVSILKELKNKSVIGTSGKDLENLAKKMMEENQVTSSCFGYKGYPSYICVSVNENLTHGIPNEKKFENGDLVSIDVSCNYQGFHADSALTFGVGEISQEKRNLLEVTKGSLDYVVKEIIPNSTTTRDVGEIIEKYVRSRGYYVIKEYGGHGIGEKLHELPFIPNYKTSQVGSILKEGMFICIEPLVQVDDDIIEVKSDQWTVASKNKKINAHFEYTIKINKDKAEILTQHDE